MKWMECSIGKDVEVLRRYVKRKYLDGFEGRTVVVEEVRGDGLFHIVVEGEE